MNSNMNNDSNLNNDSNIKNGSNIKNDSNINNGSNTNNDMYSDSDSDYMPPKRSRKKQRRNSEGDIIEIKIKQRSRSDSYFKSQSKENQIAYLNKEQEIYNFLDETIPIRYKILNSSLSINIKSLVINKINIYENMNQDDNEYTKLNKWINGLSKIPFDCFVRLPISIQDGNSKIQNFLLQSYTILKETIYGQNEAKNKIMQILAQWISNPNSQGQVIALEGPAGVGKTSLIKNGVSKVLQRPFCFYALGGAYDASLLEGHSITYEGSTWGRMCDMLMESRVMNPIIFFDELDKISVSDKGNDINGLMIHLTDPIQNSLYQDKYFSGINLDFSKAIFFFSYNNVENVNKILKDRLTVIKFHGYSIYEKIEIIQKYLLEDLLENVGLEKNDVSIENDVIYFILDTYCNKEEGMRDSKRVIEELLLRINLLKLLHSNKKNNMNKKLEISYDIPNLQFPLELTKEYVTNLLENYV